MFNQYTLIGRYGIVWSLDFEHTQDIESDMESEKSEMTSRQRQAVVEAW